MPAAAGQGRRKVGAKTLRFPQVRGLGAKKREAGPEFVLELDFECKSEFAFEVALELEFEFASSSIHLPAFLSSA